MNVRNRLDGPQMQDDGANIMIAQAYGTMSAIALHILLKVLFHARLECPIGR